MRPHSPRLRLLAAALLCVALLFVCPLFACDDASPVIAGTPTPSASPTPLPDAFSAEITAAPLPTDALGAAILSEAHYYRYLSFGNLRVYEYDDGTFLDGVCVNGYPLPLDGEIAIEYHTDTGKLCGVGTLHTADGGTVLESGSNNIYAEIRTDIDVRMMDFTFEVRRVFQPVDPAEPTP